MDKIAVIVLPGLDGSGELRVGFAEALGQDIECVLVSFPSNESLGYTELMPIVEAVIARHERYILVGESFSGPLASMLAASRPKGLIGLVLCATFCSSPRPRFRVLAPFVGWLPPKLIPKRALAWTLFGAWSRPELVASLAHVLRSIDSTVLQHRAMAVASVDVRSILSEIEVPALCLRGNSDRVVPPGASEHLCAALPNAELISIEGPHALLQAAPAACAVTVRNFLESMPARRAGWHRV